MANKPLKSIKFPSLPDTYTVPQVDNTLTVAGCAADAKETGDQISTLKADIDEIKEHGTDVYDTQVIVEYEEVTEDPKTYSDIQAHLTGSTTTGKLWNVTTGSAESVSNCRYTRYNTVGNYAKVWVSGFAQNANKPLIAFYDASDVLLASKIGIESPTGTDRRYENMLFDVPTGTSYAIVNGTSASNAKALPDVYGLVGDNPNVGTMITLEGITTNGAAWNTGGDPTAGANYKYTRYDNLPNYDKLYVTGASWWTNYPLLAFYNSSGTKISEYGPISEKYYYNIEITIPSGASYLIVNGAVSVNVHPTVKYPKADRGFVITKTQADVNDEISKLIEKKYLFVGDSYAQGYSHDGTNDGWCRYAVGYMGLTADEYRIVAEGGYSFSGGGFSTLLDSVTDTDITDVVVCGGYNDNGATAQNLLNTIASFKNKVLTKWENATVHVGFIAYNKAGDGEGAIPTWETIRANLINVTLPTYQKSITVGCEYMNNVEYWLSESGLTHSDGYHPSAEGNQSIGMAVANALKTGSAPLPYNADLRIS